MKKILKSLFIIVIVIIMVGCGIKKEHIKDISLSEFKEMVNKKESFALYVGNESCTHCVAYMPTLKSVLEEYNITIYHLDNSKLTISEQNEFTTYLNVSGTPTIAFLVDGEEQSTLSRITGSVSKEVTIKKFKNNGYIK